MIRDVWLVRNVTELFFGVHLRANISGTHNGEAKAGTTHFLRIASAYVIYRQLRLTLAVTYVLPEDDTWEGLIPAVYGVSAEVFAQGWQAYVATHYQPFTPEGMIPLPRR